MKKALALFTSLFIVATTLSSQELKPVAKAGARTLNFSFTGLGSFGLTGEGYNGGIGVSYFKDSDVAFRLGIQASYHSETSPWNSVNNTMGTDNKFTTTSFGGNFDYLTYIEGITTRVRPYWGPGVGVTYSSSDNKFSNSLNAPDGTFIETKNMSGGGLSFGFHGILGAEFFVYPEISLSAEYQVNLFTYYSRFDRVDIRKNQPDVTTKQGNVFDILGIGAGGASLHIYF
jgi:opacity protein-like surface antigen